MQIFCNGLAEGTVNTKLFREMTTFDTIPDETFNDLIENCINKSLENHKECIKNYKSKIILFICAKNSGLSHLLPQELLKIISITASMKYKIISDKSFDSRKSVVECLLQPYKCSLASNFGILGNLKYMSHYKEMGIFNGEVEVHLYCDLLEGKITEETYKTHINKIR